MIKRICLALFFLSFSAIVKSQDKLNDFTVILNEEMINKVFGAIGEIKGSNDYEVMLMKGKYDWMVRNPKILIRPDSSHFTCDATVEVGIFSYSTPVFGDVKINYENKKNEIQVKITRAIFELYTMFFGKKVHIKDIDLADYFKDPFVFEGPKSLATDFEFLMPDSTLKKIYVLPSDCGMQIRHMEIVTTCEVVVSDKPPKFFQAKTQADIKTVTKSDTTKAAKPKK
jgi:hypothetical protein